MITIMASLAQEEARSISENVTWGHRKRMADGKVTMPYGRFLGYKKGENGPEIVESEAETVRLIYRLFLQGKTANGIAQHLTSEGIPTPGGKELWRKTTIESILSNEKYKGHALLQKYHTTDFLTKTRVRSDGKIKQYYVEDSHPAIISEEDFTLVQNEMERRRGIGRNYSGGGPFATKLVCECCGAYFGAKVWHSRDQYRRVVWHCNRKYGDGKPCATPHVTDETIKERFLSAFNQMLVDKERVITDCRLAQRVLDDSREIKAALAETLREMEVVEGLAKKCIEANASTAMDQMDYTAQYNGYVARHEAAKERARDLERQMAERKTQRQVLGRLVRALAEQDAVLTAFDDNLWMEAVDRVTVRKDGKLVFVFKDGTGITV